MGLRGALSLDPDLDGERRNLSFEVLSDWTLILIKRDLGFDLFLDWILILIERGEIWASIYSQIGRTLILIERGFEISVSICSQIGL